MTRPGTIAFCCCLLTACTSGERAATPDEEVYTPQPLAAERVGETASLRDPSSVRYDEEFDAFYIASMDGDPGAKDGRASIVVVPAETLSVMRVLVDGASPGVTLHAPTGVVIAGDTIWVADIDAVRGFHRRTGAPVGSIDLSALGARLLRDVAVGPNGALYVTEAGATEADGRIYRIANRVAAEVTRGESLRSPNGIAWQDTTGTWLLAPAAGRDLLAWTEGETRTRNLARGPGRYTGIEPLRDGRVMLASEADSTVYIVHEGAMTPLITSVPSPGDIGYDLLRGVVAVPRTVDGKVEYYQLRVKG